MYLQVYYINFIETVVQLFEFPIYKEFPFVIRLPVYLESQQPVYFEDNTTADQLTGVIERIKSYLIMFFDYNWDYMDSCEVLYINFLVIYVYKQELKTWQPRRRGFSIDYIYFIPPTAGKKYYLRLFFISISGLQSFEYLQIVNSIVFSSNREICLMLGLLKDDKRQISCFTDAVV